MFDWNRPLPQERLEALIEEIAQWVHRRQLHVPAIMLLEMHKPISFFVGQGIVFSATLLAPLFGVQKVQELSWLLENRDNVEQLIQRIEALAAASNAEAPEGEKHASCQ
ncbi:hypothetical protein CWRG_01360 [Chthonomonas calidirosea]|uniref:Uncharacterized protein n=1 Tax=Chthonomonas calidirosea (strain DSM 23976 / ICMP 18418 / T49) TaxID=1303518 RepID=S0EZQ6_CHTCT|nr:hypothetical protein [Chthonomonas calidirosea]CCW36502.1 hypothetical protein CCALI_02713 [Chthonomonas calidirosea T49]CEK16051.1 hypothetical protein CWRG_01360 [Chthonomonas calidirosea]CEK16056.1 hypothetical protein CP488_01377 [Chthonomonas calidirosea]CEK17145.1 hypothetical protein CTKA_01377 [Chthonomonas calidirosea]